jgi:general secretion pathway protein B
VTQLPAQATAGLPPLNLELHVFSVDPSQRFVMINGEHLREGNALKAGAQVEKITPDGVILSYQGARFSLP